jgi:hypothetical protein
MHNLLRLGFSTLIGLAWVLLHVSAARADEITCSGWLGAVAVDNVRVPQDGACILEGTTVLGSITVESGASLTATQAQVIGNLQADGALSVRVLAGSRVGGNIQIKQGLAAEIALTLVHGDLQLEANGGRLDVTRTQVGGSVQAFQNTGGLVLTQNVIDGNLQCKENVPPPAGGLNLVQGNREDQCASLGEPLAQRLFLPAVGSSVHSAASPLAEQASGLGAAPGAGRELPAR